jgi:hypothetical protein
MLQAQGLIKDLVQFFSNYFTYSEQRISNIQADDDVNQKVTTLQTVSVFIFILLFSDFIPAGKAPS